MESQYLSVIRAWAALAWADDVLVEAEALALRRLIDRAPMLSQEERDTALRFLDHKVELDVASLERLDRSMAEGVYRAAVQLAAIDRDFASAERLFLDRLRGALRLSDEQANKIEVDVPITQQQKA